MRVKVETHIRCCVSLSNGGLFSPTILLGLFFVREVYEQILEQTLHCAQSKVIYAANIAVGTFIIIILRQRVLTRLKGFHVEGCVCNVLMAFVARRYTREYSTTARGKTPRLITKYTIRAPA